MKKGILDRLRQKGMPDKDKELTDEEMGEEFGYVDEVAKDEEEMLEEERKKRKKAAGPNLSPDKVKAFGSPFRKR